MEDKKNIYITPVVELRKLGSLPAYRQAGGAGNNVILVCYNFIL